MIEEYGKLSGEELIEEITQQIEDETEIDISHLEFSFEEGCLNVTGNLANDEQLQALIDVLENNLDPNDYDLEIEVLESSEEALDESFEDKLELEEDEFSEDAESDEVDFADDDDGYGNDKW